MPFTLIRGTYRVVGATAKGNQKGLAPDGDTVHFKPAKLSLMRQLTVLGTPLRTTSIGSAALRLEGIDALELHFPTGVKGGGETHQPRPLADDARAFLTKTLGLDPVSYVPPKLLSVKPPVPNDGALGFILSRSLDVHGRPVSFLFSGTPPAADGAPVTISASLLKKSLNYKAVLNGFAYPLFYDTLFSDLRDILRAATAEARSTKRGLWKQDLSQTGVSVKNQDQLQTRGVIFPKLFRRLSTYFANGHVGLGAFLSTAELKQEQVQILDPAAAAFTNFTHVDNILDVKNNTIKLKYKPEFLIFVSKKKKQ